MMQLSRTSIYYNDVFPASAFLNLVVFFSKVTNGGFFLPCQINVKMTRIKTPNIAI
jgi:hypothetical protein